MNKVDRLSLIVSTIKALENVSITKPLQYNGALIEGNMLVSESGVELEFKIHIYPSYPLKIQQCESIRFINKDFLEYDHVNSDGSICIIPHHNPAIVVKLHSDFNALKGWIRKYYLKIEGYLEYENILLPQNDSQNLIVYQYTQVAYNFKAGEFGIFQYSFLSNGTHRNKTTQTYVVQEFILNNKQTINCKWNRANQSLARIEGLYLYLGQKPVTKNRFIIDNWHDLEPLVSQEFLTCLYQIDRNLRSEKNPPQNITLLIGYEVSDKVIHWQALNIPTDNFPNYGEKISGKYIGRLENRTIDWFQTRDCSYNVFFGRGAFHNSITDSNILIIGAGAVGSQVATTLTRGGCKAITLLDYDLKEAENICRSEYHFITGVTAKVHELAEILTRISPFIDVKINEDTIDAIKMLSNVDEFIEQMGTYFNEYSIIIDCTSDNDLAYFIEKLPLKAHLFNLSITNHAQELVCAVNPNAYKWLGEIYSSLEKSAEIDFYNPTGCWSPTFKASYNDISLLVQSALRYINNGFANSLPPRSFFISHKDNGLTTSITPF